MGIAAKQSVKSARILIVDDDRADLELVERLLETSEFTNIAATTESSEVVALCTSSHPDLIVLDLEMPHPDGLEVMGLLSPWIRGATKLPVLAVTGGDDPESRRRALTAGARDFLAKPVDPSEVVVRVENLLEARFLQLELGEQAKALEMAVEEQSRELTEAALEAIELLERASAYRDDDQPGHALRVGRASVLLARELGLDEETVELIGLAARLHDVGKIGLPDDVLLHPAGNTPDDLELLRNHVAIGAEILGRGRSRLLKMAAEIAWTHHERWDGSGYPRGLSGHEIPVSGRVVGLADTFDGLVHPPPHVPAMRLAEAVAEIQGLADQHFDPEVVGAFNSLDHAELGRSERSGAPGG